MPRSEPSLLNYLYLLAIVVIWLWRTISKAARRGQGMAEQPAADEYEEAPPVRIQAPIDVGRLAGDLDELALQARTLGESCRRERANQRFVGLLVDDLPRDCAELRGVIRPGHQALAVLRIRQAMEVVLTEVAYLIRQRRDPELRAELGDADALADACYAPIVAHARAEGLPLTTGHPATQLGDFDLAIWTAFIPTRIAPIFLPPDFFQRVSWWPALAHEIGHDFLASVEGLEESLRHDLFLTRGEVWSAWFEELFCDIFGTMMLGPAFVTTLREHLVEEPEATGCFPHPPRSVRLQAGRAVLQRLGFHRDAAALDVGEAPARLVEMVDRLYSGPLSGLSGTGLMDVSGLSYGHAEHAAAQTVRDALLDGRVPAVRDPRMVIAGAVLAWDQRRDAADAIMRLARAAIPGRGTYETRLDAFSTAADRTRAGLAPARRDDARVYADALILREVLARPRSLRR